MADPSIPDSDYLQPVPIRAPAWRRLWAGFPAAQPPLIGREQELAALVDRLPRPDTRLLTLIGPGGVGKTRLAIAAATAAANAFPDGAAFVPLAAIQDPGHTLSAVAQTLGVRESSQRPLAQLLAAALQDRRFLLVLDNCEHLLPAAPEIAQLLSACPQLTVLATSRAPLRLSSEERVATRPLALPAEVAAEPDALAGYGAIALFGERARWVEPGFALTAANVAAVTEICRRLDGLPLAIELAAPWVRVMTPEALLGRLEPRLPLLRGGPSDQPARLRTMRDAIAWSYALLTPEEARLFRRLAVFVGGFTLEAAEVVGGEEGKGGESLELLASLVDKSLVQVTTDGPEARFGMLETVREFALEGLAASGEADEVAAAHAAVMAAFAERAEPHLLGPEERIWRQRCDAELGNIRAALAWAVEHDVEIALRIGAALWLYWNWSLVAEGRRWLGAALERSSDEPALTRARAFITHGALAALTGDRATCASSGAAAIPLAIAADDPIAEGLARWVKASSLFDAKTVAQTAPYLDEVIALLDQATTPTTRVQAALARVHRGVAALAMGDAAHGIALYDEAIAQVRAIGSESATLVLLGDLAGWLIDVDDVDRARELAQEALAMATNHASWLMASSMSTLTLIAALEGKAETAARRIGAIDVSWRLAGLAIPPHYQQRIDRAAALAEATLGQKAFFAAQRVGSANPQAVVAEALANVAVGHAAEVEHDTETGLSPRQREVLTLLVAGRTDRQIAEELFISQRTASHHVTAIMSKLRASTRGEAAVRAVRAGLI